jgi:hypothetical protein
MLLVGTLILVFGCIVAQSGIEAMKDPNSPLDRAGGYRVFAGTTLLISGLGISLAVLLTRAL